MTPSPTQSPPSGSARSLRFAKSPSQTGERLSAWMRYSLPISALGFAWLAGAQLSGRASATAQGVALLLMLGAALMAWRAGTTQRAWWLAGASALSAALLGAATLSPAMARAIPAPLFVAPPFLLAMAAFGLAPRDDKLARAGRFLEAMMLSGCFVAATWWSGPRWLSARPNGGANNAASAQLETWHLLAALFAGTSAILAWSGARRGERAVATAFGASGLALAWSEMARAFAPSAIRASFWMSAAPLLAFAILLAWSAWESSESGAKSDTETPDVTQTRPYLAGVRMPGAWLLAASSGALASNGATSLPHGAHGEPYWLAGLAGLGLLRALVGARRERARDLELHRLSHFNLGLRDELSERARDLELLHRATRELNSSLNPVKVLHIGLERGIALLRAQGGALWLRAELSASMSGGDPSATAPSMAPLQREMERVATEQRVLSALRAGAHGDQEVEREDLFLSGACWHMVGSRGLEIETVRASLIGAHACLEREGLDALLDIEGGHSSGQGRVQLIALSWNGGVAGVLALSRDGEFSGAERELAELLGREIGSALQNAHLFQEASRLADRDAVTDLLNHRAMQSQIGAQVSRAKRANAPLSVVMMDLHNFKFFNETYGHAAGDRVLRTVAACLREVCRVSDVLSRFGPDEFLAVLPDTDVAGTVEVCSRVASRLQRESYPDPTGRQIPITLAFGAAFYPADGDHAPELLARALEHLNEAKNGNGPRSADEGPLKIEVASEEQVQMRRLKEREVGGSFGVLDALVTAIDNKDHYTRRHSEDVAHWAALMARKLNFSDEALQAVRVCGLLHDVGKIAVPDAILRKPGRLEDDEFNIMQQHPVFGALIVKDVPNLPEVLGGIRHHHERFDGKGYPDKLQGENIPQLGRLLAVPDCFSAMTTDRPYRKALTWQDALDEIRKGRGTQFDPQMADAFAQVIAEVLGRDKAAPQNAQSPELPLVSSQVGDYLDATQSDESSVSIGVPRSVADAK